MDADNARDAADTNLAAANETAALLAAERRSRAAQVGARVGARSDRARERTRAAVGEEISRAAKRLRKEQAATAGLRASGAAKGERPAYARAARVVTGRAARGAKERARLNRRIKQLELELDNARRDAAAARADEAAARAGGAADRAKIGTLNIPKAKW